MGELSAVDVGAAPVLTFRGGVGKGDSSAASLGGVVGLGNRGAGGANSDFTMVGVVLVGVTVASGATTLLAGKA